jgi:hypothetical protein
MLPVIAVDEPGAEGKPRGGLNGLYCKLKVRFWGGQILQLFFM